MDTLSSDQSTPAASASLTAAIAASTSARLYSISVALRSLAATAAASSSVRRSCQLTTTTRLVTTGAVLALSDLNQKVSHSTRTQTQDGHAPRHYGCDRVWRAPPSPALSLARPPAAPRTWRKTLSAARNNRIVKWVAVRETVRQCGWGRGSAPSIAPSKVSRFIRFVLLCCHTHPSPRLSAAVTHSTV
jgi:hypothetical protein